MTSINSGLRYLSAARVDTPLGNLDHVVVRSSSVGTVVKLDGIIVDPVERHVCYFVINSRRGLKRRQYLMPFTPARIDSEHGVLEIDLEEEDLERLPEVRAKALPPFSDDDFITALFSTPAAGASPDDRDCNR